MNPTNQLDYALGRLEGQARSEAEAEIADDQALAERLDRLGLSLRLLLDDGRALDPPGGLAERTMALVAERPSRRVILDFVPARIPFRWSDVAVAAGILVAGLLTLLPAVRQSRERMSQAGCGFNLQQLGVGLSNYAIRHNTYPDVHAPGPGTRVGVYAQALTQENLLRDPGSLRCPCNASNVNVSTDEAALGLAILDYAYHVGYRQASGQPGPVLPRCPSTVPLLADKPPLNLAMQVLEGNSPNHRWRGQNVLFADMHVAFFPTRRISPLDEDLFLNDENRPAPGLDSTDAVLVSPATPAMNR